MQVITTLKEGVKVEDLTKILEPFRLNVAVNVPGYRASAWSVDSANDRKIFFFAGWDSLEVRLVLAQASTLVLTDPMCGPVGTGQIRPVAGVCEAHGRSRWALARVPPKDAPRQAC